MVIPSVAGAIIIVLARDVAGIGNIGPGRLAIAGVWESYVVDKSNVQRDTMLPLVLTAL